MPGEDSQHTVRKVSFRIIFDLLVTLVSQLGLCKLGLMGISALWAALVEGPPPASVIQASSGARRIAVEVTEVGVNSFQAEQATERDAVEKLQFKLQELAKELSGRELTPYELLQEKVWLLRQPGVKEIYTRTPPKEEYNWKQVERSLYYKSTHTITLEIPEETIARWARKLIREPWRNLLNLLSLVGAIGVGWILGLGLMVRLDRLSGGYYRGFIVSVYLIGIVIISAVTVVWWNFSR
jgi:hypothetical protein